MKQYGVFLVLLLCVSCSGPTKAGKEARANAHQRMAIVNADLAAQQAKQQFEVGQLDSAKETISSAITRYSEKGDYHLLKGRILLEQHHLDAAFRALQKAVEYSPDLAEPHYFLGILHQRWAEDDKALAEYKIAMEKDSSHPQYLLAAAESYVALNQNGEAIALLVSASQEFQHHPSVASLLGHIYLREGEYGDASDWLENSRLLGNDDKETHSVLATAQFEAGRYGDCLSTLTNLEELHGTLQTAFVRLQGKCFAATGRLLRGRDICLKITHETPEDIGAWKDLGYISWQMGDYKRLGRCGEKIVQLDADVTEGNLFIGVSAIHSDNAALALETLSSLQSDNSIEGLDSLINIYAKNTKIGIETPITPNMQAKTVEGVGESFFKKLLRGSNPLASVHSDSDAP